MSTDDERLFHRAHYNILAKRFREQIEAAPNEDAVEGLARLAGTLADRFEKDNQEFDREFWFQNCGL